MLLYDYSIFQRPGNPQLLLQYSNLVNHPKTQNPSLYQPISLQPVLGKILEKILLKRFSHITEENKNLPNFQFGFRINHFTTHQLYRVTDTIATALETKKYYAGVLLDVVKAFDTVWHEGLL